MHLHRFVGLSGAHIEESEKIKALSRWLYRLQLLVIFTIVLQWHAEIEQLLTLTQSRCVDTALSLFLLFEFAVLYLAVSDKKRFLRGNWALIIIPILYLPMLSQNRLTEFTLFSLLRLLLAAWLLIPWIEVSRRNLSDNKIGTTLLTAVFITILAGIIMAGIDPEIHSLRQGIWWAWVTVTTVGYGDVVPSTWTGKLFGGVLILMGLGLFSVITANFSALFFKSKLHKSMDELKKENAATRAILLQLREIRREDKDVLQAISSLNDRIDTLEEQVIPHKRKPTKPAPK